MRENPDEFDADQRKKDQQIDAQRPEGGFDRACGFDPGHKTGLILVFELRSPHQVLVAHHPKQMFLRVHHGQYPELILGE